MRRAYTFLIGTVAGCGLDLADGRHPAGAVALFSMLVPVVGLGSAWIVLGESLTTWELVGSAVVVAGVLLGSRRSAR